MLPSLPPPKRVSRRALLCVSWLALHAAVLAGAPATPRPDPQRFSKEIAAFDAEESTRPPPRQGIVFTGSSSIRLWNVGEAFPDLPVVNRGFGGSVANDLTVHAEKVVLRYQPRLLVVYTGGNDLNAKLSPAEAFDDYTRFLRGVHRALPKTRVIVNSVKVAESRAAQIPAVHQLNARLESWCRGRRWTRWVESTHHLLDSAGKPRPELFLSDRLHLNSGGYAEWKKILEPILRQEWARANR